MGVKWAMNDKKRAVALTSIFAAIFLTVTKLTVGILTNSLGILAEALHSALDLVAAIITFIAVSISKRPADDTHNFGHGKVENFSALVETFILIVTCGWIIFEAYDRLTGKHVQVEVNVFSFLVIILAIIIDYERSRLLYKIGKETNSQALQADALHFSTDILSSSVVIIGLIFVSLGIPIGDSVAALGVAVIVMWISTRLGQRTIDALMDKTPNKEYKLIQDLFENDFQQYKIKRLRLRESGPQFQGDLIVEAPKDFSFSQIQVVNEIIEKKIKSLISNIDILVITYPSGESNVSIFEDEVINNYYTILHTLKIPTNYIYQVENISIYLFKNNYYCDLHLILPSSLSLKEAHSLTELFEEEVKKLLPLINKLNIHVEPLNDKLKDYHPIIDENAIQKIFKDIISEYSEIENLKSIEIAKQEENLIINATISLDGERSLTQVHNLTNSIEFKIQSRLPNVERIILHTEPT